MFRGLDGKLAQTSTRLTGYGNVAIQVKGESFLKGALNGTEFQLRFIIVDVDGTPILGLKSCERLNLVNTVSEVKCFKNNNNVFECNKKYILKTIQAFSLVSGGKAIITCTKSPWIKI